jgi:hypothetical protein
MLEQLKNLIGKKNSAPPAPPVKKPAPAEQTTVQLLSWQPAKKNPRLLTAYKPGTDPTNPNNLVTVNVAANHNFMPHMRLQVRQTSERIYDLVGPLPRWKGRW